MKNINQGLGYLASAAVSIAVVAFTKNAIWAFGIFIAGFYFVSNMDN